MVLFNILQVCITFYVTFSKEDKLGKTLVGAPTCQRQVLRARVPVELLSGLPGPTPPLVNAKDDRASHRVSVKALQLNRSCQGQQAQGRLDITVGLEQCQINFKPAVPTSGQT